MADRPNVVFMLADNIGWGDLSSYGNLNPTPRLDQLASEGIRFTNFNTEAQCTPTRSAVMTGRMPVRSGTFSVPLGGAAEYGLCPWEYTMGELFSDAGYATGMFGKWHLGKAADRIPTAQGFDEWWGISESS
ncbi:MAG: sulfatase-like hydrolase/transferase, partial [Acidimicrobiia bacterium]